MITYVQALVLIIQDLLYIMVHWEDEHAVFGTSMVTKLAFFSFLFVFKCPGYQALITNHFRETGSHYLLIAGAMPPTDPGPGMFPATAAA